jgi:hypothetical protein
MVSGFNNPNPRKVRELLKLPLGHDPWPHVAVTGKTEEQTRVTVTTYQRERHQIAHGQSRPKYQDSDLRGRIAFFDELVGLLDRHFEAELTTKLGRSPW